MCQELADVEEFRRALAEGPTEEICRQLEMYVVARRERRGGHAQWALLCEECGLWQLAFREFQLALRDDPEDWLALERLACLYRERGELDKAADLLQRMVTLRPNQFDAWRRYIEVLLEQDAVVAAAEVLDQAKRSGFSEPQIAALRSILDNHLHSARPQASQPDEEPISSLNPTEADCTRFCLLFSGREEVYARQWVRGTETGYTPVYEPLTPQVARNHFLGNYTIGVYPLRADGTATFFVVDLDIDRAALHRARSDPAYAQWLRDTLRKEAPRLVQALSDYGFPVLFENSGYKGRHFWVFLENPETAATLQVLGKCLLHRLLPLISPGFHLEFFPKQSELKGKGLGNLIKLPLGIHRRTGRRSTLLDAQGNVIADPLAHLRTVQRCSKDTLYSAIERLKRETAGRHGEPAWAEKAVADAPEVEMPAADAQPAVAPAEAALTPIPAPPQWTEGDFQADPAVRHMLARCPVLAELKRRVDEHRHLAYEEQLVLIHTMGHLESGPLAVNYLLEKCVDVSPDKLLKSPLRGNPMSCPAIRRRIPHITSRVPCNCDFSFASDRYPSPVVHLVTLDVSAASTRPTNEVQPLTDVAHRLAHLERRRRQLEQEYQALRDHLVERLRRVPERSVSCPDGIYRLIEREGVEELIWAASSDASKGNGNELGQTGTGKPEMADGESRCDRHSEKRLSEAHSAVAPLTAGT